MATTCKRVAIDLTFKYGDTTHTFRDLRGTGVVYYGDKWKLVVTCGPKNDKIVLGEFGRRVDAHEALPDLQARLKKAISAHVASNNLLWSSVPQLNVTLKCGDAPVTDKELHDVRTVMVVQNDRTDGVLDVVVACGDKHSETRVAHFARDLETDAFAEAARVASRLAAAAEAMASKMENAGTRLYMTRLNATLTAEALAFERRASGAGRQTQPKNKRACN